MNYRRDDDLGKSVYILRSHRTRWALITAAACGSVLSLPRSQLWPRLIPRRGCHRAPPHCWAEPASKSWRRAPRPPHLCPCRTPWEGSGPGPDALSPFLADHTTVSPASGKSVSWAKPAPFYVSRGQRRRERGACGAQMGASQREQRGRFRHEVRPSQTRREPPYESRAPSPTPQCPRGRRGPRHCQILTLPSLPRASSRVEHQQWPESCDQLYPDV